MNTSAYTLILPNEVTASNIAEVLATFARNSENSPTIRIDASGLQHFDSAVLALLLTMRREAEAAQRTWQLDGAAPKLCELAQLYGVHDLLFGAPEGTTMH